MQIPLPLLSMPVLRTADADRNVGTMYADSKLDAALCAMRAIQCWERLYGHTQFCTMLESYNDKYCL